MEHHRIRKLAIAGLITTSLFGAYISSNSYGFVTPFGPVFLTTPTEEQKRHEECHMDRVREIGYLEFATDYLLGGGWQEEARCGTPDHFVKNWIGQRPPQGTIYARK